MSASPATVAITSIPRFQASGRVPVGPLVSSYLDDLTSSETGLPGADGWGYPPAIRRSEGQEAGLSRIDAQTDLTAEVDLEALANARTDLHDPQQRSQVERALCAVPGVLGARLVPGFERQVDELHVLTNLDRAPKQTVRDVQTVLMARFGIPTDHRVVSVVQLDESEALASTSRVIVEQVGLSQSGPTVAATVVVRDGDEQLNATVEGGASQAARNRTVGRATLQAIEPLLAASGIVELEGIEMMRLAGVEVAVSVVHVRTDRTELTLSGSAVVRETPADAVARSVLDALNRTMA
jgi:hypothetical protein